MRCQIPPLRSAATCFQAGTIQIPGSGRMACCGWYGESFRSEGRGVRWAVRRGVHIPESRRTVGGTVRVQIPGSGRTLGGTLHQSDQLDWCSVCIDIILFVYVLIIILMCSNFIVVFICGIYSILFYFTIVSVVDSRLLALCPPPAFLYCDFILEKHEDLY